MAVNILMPALSPTMTDGTLARWVVGEGDAVRSGDVIAEIETDKATMEVEAVDEGFVEKLLFKEGDLNIPVNKPIAIISSQQSSQSKVTNQKENSVEEQKITQTKEVKQRENQLPKEAVVLDDKHITMREAIRDTIAEEMRKDKKVFILGEEVAEYQGAYKVTQGLLAEFGEKKGHRHTHL